MRRCRRRSPAAQLAPRHLPAAYKWWSRATVNLGTTLEVLDTSIVNVALPHMQKAFSIGVDEIALVLTSYLVANGIIFQSRLGFRRDSGNR